MGRLRGSRATFVRVAGWIDRKSMPEEVAVTFDDPMDRALVRTLVIRLAVLAAFSAIIAVM
jgi:hypothetical protein